MGLDSDLLLCVPDSVLYSFVLFPVKTEIPVELCRA